MEPVSVALAYCIDNLPVAEALEQVLTPTTYHFQHFYCKKDQPGLAEPLAQQLQYHEGPILLLVSDNFLKSLTCMNQALKLIQLRTSDIIPVVIDGTRLDESTNQFIAVPTRFEKIGDIIPYINYWQNRFLDLRQQRKDMETDSSIDQESLGAHLRVLRQVSSEASEYLRVLRNMQHYSFQTFSANHFQAFFQHLGDEETWNTFQAKHPNLELPPALVPNQNPEVPTAEETDDVPDDSSIDDTEVLAPEGIDNINRILNLRKPDQETDEPNEIDLSGLEDESPAPTPTQLNNDSEVDSKEETALPDDQMVDEHLGGPAGKEEQPDEVLQEEVDELEDSFDEDELLPEAGTRDLSDEFNDGLIVEIPESGEKEEIEEPPLLVNQIIEQALILANADQSADALSLLEQALNKAPYHTDLRYHYALIMAQQANSTATAIEELEILLGIDSEHLKGNFLMGELAELQERYTDAQWYYEKVVAIAPDYQDVYARMGFVAQNSEPAHKKMAKKYFKKAIKHNPDHVDAHYQYALLVNELDNKPHKAIKFLKRTLELQPRHPFANYDLALLYHQLGSRVEANSHYQKAIAINPELQTEENDAAFSKPVKKAFLPKTGTMEHSTIDKTPEVVGKDTFSALKENIKKLEALLSEKTKQKATNVPKVDKIVFITGATAGIGRATAITFAANGYRLLLNGRRIEKLEALKQQLVEQYQSDVLLLPFDVRDFRASQNAIEHLPQEWQQIDILINNAGKAKGFSPIQEGELHHWEEMIDVNIKGLLYLTRLVAPAMVQRNNGHIINLGSTAGKEVYPNGNVYCATKAAVEALTKSIRLDLFKHNIRVSQVSPGHVEETEFALVRFDGDAERAKIYEDFKPLTSRDVAETIFFIASRPPHVNIQDVLLMGTQQAGSNFIDRSGRKEEEEE